MSNTHARALAEREAFEAEISGMPYEKSVVRFPNDATKFAWPGNYRDISVDLAWNIWQARAALSAPAAVAGWQDEPDAEDLARMRSVNEWHNLQDIVPTLKAAKAGEWHWYENTRCKYIEVRIDMRDLGCIVMDRERVRITPALLAKQLTAAAPKPSPEGAV